MQNFTPKMREALINFVKKCTDQETERLKAELNELKERHKRDVRAAFEHGCEFSDDGIYYMSKKSYFSGKSEQYYKQKFESND